MKISYSWLNDFFGGKLGAVSPEEISYVLTRQGITVDQVIQLGKGMENVVVGHLNEVQKHPQADRLTVCRVNVGDKASRTIVCGAKNHKVNDFVLAALPGATLPNGLYIKETNLRGVTSQGMLCSRTELGLPPSSDPAENDGIIILKGKQKTGIPAAEALGLQDTIFELDVTPNRGDCLSVLGIARELAAGLKRNLEIPQPKLEINHQRRGEQEVALEVVAEECPYFTLQVIKGIKVGPSPEWIQTRLMNSGMRPINNIVDVTNLVMLETGQPLHAYDVQKNRDQKFIVRRAKAQMPFHALDDSKRELSNQDLVICDKEQVLCLAGVMGGFGSGISELTTDLALEAAFFDPVSVRKTARRHGFHTESSHRFERTVDPAGIGYASQRATELILQVAGGTLLGGIVTHGEPPLKNKAFNVDLRHYERVIGAPVSVESATEVLKRLHIEVEKKSSNVIRVTPPSYRHDLMREVDIMEEIARLIGYDAVPSTLPRRASRELTEKGASWHWVSQLKKECVGAGFSEAILYSMIPDKFKEFHSNPLFPQTEIVSIKNPISDEFAILRPTGLIGLIQALQRNMSHHFNSVSLFEVATIFSKSKQPYPQKFRLEKLKRDDIRGVEEKTVLSLLMAGQSKRDPGAQMWDVKDQRPFDFFDLKGRIEAVTGGFCLGSLVWQPPQTPVSYLHPYQQCEILLHRNLVGYAGQLHPTLSKTLELDSVQVWLAEIDLGPLMAHVVNPRYKFEMPSPFQRVERDAAFIVDSQMPAQFLLEAVKKKKLGLLRDLVIFDVFEGKGIPEGKKSIAIRFTYQASDATLTDELINEAFHACIHAIQEGTKAELRGSI